MFFPIIYDGRDRQLVGTLRVDLLPHDVALEREVAWTINVGFHFYVLYTLIHTAL